MTICNHLSRIGAVAALAATLAACQTPKAPTLPAIPQFKDVLAEAQKVSASGDKEAAIGLWKKSAELYPKEKAPWSSIAQARFDAGQYGEAIQAALEVLVRDPNDSLANSIIAVSGLKLSTRALGDLSRQNNLSGPVRTEAQDLARLLRSNLGPDPLFGSKQDTVTKPPVATGGRPGRPGRPGTAATAATTTTTTTPAVSPSRGTTTPPAPKPPASTSDDPFGVLGR